MWQRTPSGRGWPLCLSCRVPKAWLSPGRPNIGTPGHQELTGPLQSPVCCLSGQRVARGELRSLPAPGKAPVPPAPQSLCPAPPALLMLVLSLSESSSRGLRTLTRRAASSRSNWDLQPRIRKDKGEQPAVGTAPSGHCPTVPALVLAAGVHALSSGRKAPFSHHKWAAGLRPHSLPRQELGACSPSQTRGWESRHGWHRAGSG